MNHQPSELHFSGKTGQMPKYKIQECLDKLTINEYRSLVKAMPAYLGRSINTFWNYAKIPVNSKLDIPHITVRMLEILFVLKPGELLNIPVKGDHYYSVVHKFNSKNKNSLDHSYAFEDEDLQEN